MQNIQTVLTRFKHKQIHQEEIDKLLSYWKMEGNRLNLDQVQIVRRNSQEKMNFPDLRSHDPIIPISLSGFHEN